MDETTPEIDLKRVLVAYDFSDYSVLALNYGLSLAQEYQAELHLLHVLPPAKLDEPEISWYPMGKEGTYHKSARRLQDAVPAEAHLWCNIKHAVSEGQPYREILNYADKNQIDLICIGAHGTGFGMRTLFGSNVDRVCARRPARCWWRNHSSMPNRSPLRRESRNVKHYAETIEEQTGPVAPQIAEIPYPSAWPGNHDLQAFSLRSRL